VNDYSSIFHDNAIF